MSEIEHASVDEIFDFKDADAPEDQTETKKKRRWLKMSLTTLLVAVLAIGVAGVGLLFYIKSQIQSTDFSANDFDHNPAAQGTIGTVENFLILGSDSRISQGSNEWSYGAQRSDVMMIVQISADRKHISIMSIPRDSAVEIPGREGLNKNNAAFSWGGVPLTVSTVEGATGIRIDHVAYLDFQSFVALTDAVGGVTMTSVDEGTRDYTGKEALTFVRTRKALPNGDFDRVRRQQAWMSAVFRKVFIRDVLTNPSKVKKVYDALIPNVALDQSVDMSYSLGLTISMGRADDVSLHFVTAPIGGSSNDGEYLAHFDEERFTPLCEAFRQGKAWEYIDTHSDLDTLASRPVE